MNQLDVETYKQTRILEIEVENCVSCPEHQRKSSDIFHDRAGRKPTALAVGGMPLSIYTYRTKYSIHYATNGKGEVTDVAGATR